MDAKKNRTLLVAFFWIFSGCSVGGDNELNTNNFSKFINEYIVPQVKFGIDFHIIDSTKVPRSLKDGEIRYAKSISEWTNGFYPGILWSLYQYTRDVEFHKYAHQFTWQLRSLKEEKSTHDIGFLINSSFGKAYQITADEMYLDVLISGAENLSSRYNPSVGCIKSWDWGKSEGWDFPVIIDNMMNLEILFTAFELTGRNEFYDIAVSHAYTTLENHYRNDHSSYHVVDFDSETGQVRSKGTHQGISDDSDWSRGQAWGLYGFTMSYRYTGNTDFLQQAEMIASYLINHPNLPSDFIPFWDLKDPDIPNTYRDTSSACIIASALIELFEHTRNDAYLDASKEIINALMSERYLVQEKTHYGFLLKNSVGFLPKNWEVDVSITYADYYFIEALIRLDKIS